MADFSFFLQVEHIAIDMVLGQHTQREGRDEFFRALRHHCAHGQPFAAQQAHQFERFIGRDAAGDDEQDAFFGHG